jgi:hypothetical protein
MKIRNMVLVLGLAVFGGAMWAGCGSNPCQDLEDAINAASKAKNCSGKLPKITTDTSNCPTDAASVKILNCETAAFKTISDCNKDLVKASMALSKCATGG